MAFVGVAILVGVFIGFTVPVTGLAVEKAYDVELGSRIHGSGEQPKMLFILPWRSQIEQDLKLRTSIDGYFDELLQPKSKDDLEYELEILSKQLN